MLRRHTFDCKREGHVQHTLDIGDVEAPRSDVCSDEQGRLAGLESLQCAHPLVLAEVAMNCADAELVILERGLDATCLLLIKRENENARVFGQCILAQELQKLLSTGLSSISNGAKSGL
ncbi:hypothetical protein, partial [Moraxella catarrhalis]|uniref:hypothetical protein n=1 Tax=Moraxella catarrhalis TaxID=480 RepID=UPI0029E80B6D